MIETVWTPRPAFVGVRDTREPQTRAKRGSLGVTVTSDPNRACTIETESSPGAPLVSPNPGCFLCLPLPVSLSPFYHPVRCLGFFFLGKTKWNGTWIHLLRWAATKQLNWSLWIERKMCLIEKYHYWIFKEMKGEKQSTLKSSLQLGNGNALEGKVVTLRSR